METKNIILFVFDTKENFEKSKNGFGSEGLAFKKIICVEDVNGFETELLKIDDNDLVFMAVHVFYTNNIIGIKLFTASLIHKRYPNLGFKYISEGDSKEINIQMIQNDLKNEKIFKYWEIQENLENGQFIALSKTEIMQLAAVTLNNTANVEQIDVAIIAALYDDEFTSLDEFLEDRKSVPGFETMMTAKLKNSTKRILVDFQTKMGMVEATYLSTQILSRFSPKYLIMIGVCGGRFKKDVKLLDIIIPSKVFDYQTGKYDNGVFKPYLRACNINNKKAIASSKAVLKSMEDYLPGPLKLKCKNIVIHGKTMACGNIVVKTNGYLEETISNFDEETQGVEMESFGVVRTTELIEDKKVTPIIIKAVMDYTEKDKNDKDKENAAYLSACFAYFLVKDHL